MRTTMIGPNYRWRGRAQDVLVSLSEAQLTSDNPLLLSLRSPSYPFLFLSVPRKFLSFSRDREVRLCVVHKVRVFLGRCIHAFPFSCLTLCLTLPLPSPLVHRYLSPPPAPEEIKPHLSSLIIVVTYAATSSGSEKRAAWARRCKNSQPGEQRRAKTTGKERNSQRTTRPSFPFR